MLALESPEELASAGRLCSSQLIVIRVEGHGRNTGQDDYMTNFSTGDGIRPTRTVLFKKMLSKGEGGRKLHVTAFGV